MTTASLPFAYEFRFFAPLLTSELALLSAHGVAREPEDTTETYVVSRFTIDASVKMSEGRLEIKELAERAGILEGWVRALDLGFPISGEVFLSEGAQRLGAHPEVDTERLLYESDIVAIAREYAGLASIEVTKRRTIFDLDECRGEFVSITAGHHQADTIAIEGRAVGDVLRKLDALRFADRVNESYPCYLQRLVFYAEQSAHG